MLSLADQGLVQRETALRLDVLFDDEAVAALLQKHYPELAIQKVRAHYVRYKPHTNCLVHYAVTTASGEDSFYVNAYGPGAQDKLTKAAATVRLETHRVVVAQQALVLHRFPDDKNLKRLAVFDDTDQQQELLQELLPEVVGARFEQLSYKPERRLALRLTSERGQAVLKFYTPDDFAKANIKAKTFAAQHAVRVPRVLATSSRYGVIALEWLDGTLLKEAFLSAEFSAKDVNKVGRALAAVHAQAFDLPVCAGVAAHARLREISDYLGWLHPNLSKRLAELQERIRSMLRPAERLVTLHGDFYSNQVLFQQTGIAFLDFDEAHCGDAAFDIGLFLAHLEVDVLRGVLPGAVVNDIGENLLQGYEDAAGYLPKNVTAYTAIGMLSLLPHFFRNRYPDWPELMEGFLARADQLVSQEPRANAATL